MAFLFIKNLPRYECLLEAAKLFPDLNPSACEVFLHLMRAGDEAFRAVDSHLAQHHLSQGRFMVLALLYERLRGCPHPRTPAELADLSHVTRATMTGLVDTLERDGLVTREPDPTDRRMMSVALTEKGRTLLETVLPWYFQRMAALVQPLDETERKTLVTLLGKIFRQADALTAPAAANGSATPAGAAIAPAPPFPLQFSTNQLPPS